VASLLQRADRQDSGGSSLRAPLHADTFNSAPEQTRRSMSSHAKLTSAAVQHSCSPEPSWLIKVGSVADTRQHSVHAYGCTFNYSFTSSLLPCIALCLLTALVLTPCLPQAEGPVHCLPYPNPDITSQSVHRQASPSLPPSRAILTVFWPAHRRRPGAGTLMRGQGGRQVGRVGGGPAAPGEPTQAGLMLGTFTWIHLDSKAVAVPADQLAHDLMKE